MPSEAGGSIPSLPTYGPEALEMSAGSNNLGGVDATPTRSAKLYAVGRRDLPPGLRAAQLGHACIHWVLKFGKPPDNLVLVETEDREALEALRDALRAEDIPLVEFHEPDLNDELTALAVDPSGWKRLSELPLAFR